MNELKLLKSRLLGLQMRRRTASWIAAIAAVLAITLSGLIVAFGIDVAFHLGHVERVIILICWSALTLWALFRFVGPLFSDHETLADIALAIEERQGIPSELIAALQFEDKKRCQYGLEGLRSAVVNETANLSEKINYRCPKTQLGLVKKMLAAILVLAAGGVLFYYAGDHVRVFCSRFVLQETTYPTKTQLELLSPGERIAYGRPVQFRIKVGGLMPEGGQVKIRTQTSDDITIVDLLPDPTDRTLYVGQLRRAIEDCTYEVKLGDARIGPRTFTVIPLPKVVLTMESKPPAYAAKLFSANTKKASQKVVLEGTEVTPVVTADKPLHAATIKIDDKEFKMQKKGNSFLLPPKASPLQQVAATLRYEVQVEDEDGLQLERPLSGVLRVQKDRQPRITASTVTRNILASASPRVQYVAGDDFGIQKVQLLQTVIRGGVSGEQKEPTPKLLFEAEKKVPLAVENNVTLSFSELNLEPGDRVICVLQAIDFRGDQPGLIAQSESLVFEVTDRETLIQSFSETDEKIDQDLESIIRAESGLGEKR